MNKYTLGNTYFCIFMIIFLIHQITQKVLGISFPLLDNYLDPLLFMPIILNFILWERRYLFKKGSDYTLPIPHVLILWICLSILTEYFFPRWNSGFTADILDVCCYGLGTLFFLLFMNKRIIKGKP